MVDRTQCAPFSRDLVRSRMPRSKALNQARVGPRAWRALFSALATTVAVLRKPLSNALLALLLNAPFTASGWPPHREGVSPHVDAWSHEEACDQHCVSRFGDHCVSASFAFFVRRVPTGGFDGELSCNFSWREGTTVKSAVLGAAYVNCGLGPNSLISEDGNECRCEPSKRWTGGRCVPICPARQFWNDTLGTCSSTNVDLAKSRGPSSCPASRNPIYPATGNKCQIETDYLSQGPLSVALKRYYNASVGPDITAFRQPAGFGFFWSGEYSRSLHFSGFEPAAVSAVRQDGRVYVFRRSGSEYQGDADVIDGLTAITDAPGAITGWRYLVGATEETETYDAQGALVSLSDRAGVTTTFTYDANKYLVQATDAFGKSLSLTYDSQGRVASMTDPASNTYRYAYDSADRLVSVTFPDTRVRTYHYENASVPRLLTGITDENGQRFVTWSYDAQGRATLSERAGGADRVTVTYGTNTAAVTDAFGQTRTYAFSPVLGINRNTAVSGPACPSCGPASQAVDANGNAASRVDWNGNRTNYSYDLARNLETQRVEGLTAAGGTTPQTRTITTEWHATYRLPTRQAEPLRITTYVYGEPTDPSPGNRGSLLAKTVQATNDATGAQGFSATPVGTPRTWIYTYNANGQVLTVDGPRTDAADVTTYTYYPNDDPDLGKRGNAATITNTLGQRTQISVYNAHGQPLTIVDPNGLVTTLTYDQRQRLTSRTVGTETTSYEYDGVGQMTKVTLPDGSFLSYTYDGAHRLTAIQDNLGNRMAYTLDAMGNRTREDVFDPVSALAQTRSRVYSGLNRLDQEIGGTNPAAQVTSYAYDNQGYVTSITDPLNRVTVNAYDALSRMKQVIDPASGVTGYGYDGLDQLVSVSDPRSNTTGYTLDGLSNLAAQSSPEAGTTANTHDAAGDLITSTDAKGQSTSYTYDALNRVTRMVYNQATGTQLKQVDYAYDQGANGIGRLTSITEISAAGPVLQTTTYGYDPQGRIVSETRAIGGQTYTTAYAYDAAGRMAGMTYPSGRTTSYGFDGLGRVNRIETTGGGQTQVVVQDVLYHPFGPAKAFIFGNLQASTRGFDLDGRIASHSLGGPTKLLGFDAASRITSIAEQGNPANTTSYGYDALDRLTNAVLPTSTFAFGYDPVGNRLSKSIGGSTDAYTYSPTSNRLSAITGASGTRSYVHDANGSVTGDGANSFAYDARGRLVSAVSSAGPTSFQVNALGQRVRKSSALGDAVYHYDTQGRLIAESSPAGPPVREYLWLNDQPVAVATAQSQSGTGCPATPQLDTSSTFRPFAPREGLEAHSGRPGARGWEWRIGTNLRRARTSDETDLDWVSGKPYGFRLTYDGAGSASVTVQDGQMELFTLSQSGGMDVGNALQFQVQSAAAIEPGTLIQASITSIDGQAVSETLQTAGDGTFSELAKVFAGESLKNGFMVEGTVSLTFTGSYPPRGSRLRFLVAAGNVTCQGPSPATEAKLYYIHADHLNTPRVITNDFHQLVWRWENTEPFGKSPPEEDPDGDGQRFEFPLRFPGQYFDRETSTAYNYQRDYDPQIGRYVQSDPIGLAGGINPYLYVDGNPVSLSDPTGELPPLILAAAAGAAVGAVVQLGVTYATSTGPLTSQQIIAALGSGAASGALSALGGPLGGSIAKFGGYAASGALGKAGGVMYSALAGGTGQAVSNLIDPCHASSITNAALFGGLGQLGGNLTAAVFGVSGYVSLAQLQRFGYQNISSLLGRQYGQIYLSSTYVSALVGASSSLGNPLNLP